MAKLFKLNDKPKSKRDYLAQVAELREQAILAIMENRSINLPDNFMHGLYENISKADADRIVKEVDDIVESYS